MSLATQSMSELERSVLARIDQERLVGRCAQLIEAPSENPGGSEERTVQLLREMLEELGASVHLQQVAEGRPNLVAHLGGGNRVGYCSSGTAMSYLPEAAGMQTRSQLGGKAISWSVAGQRT